MDLRARLAGGAGRCARLGARATGARAGTAGTRRARPCGPADLNQGLWFEIYTGRDRPAGIYRGTIDLVADGETRHVPVELEILDFALPDENSMHAMLFYTSDQPERYHGRNLDDAYNRFAHRYRTELVHEFDEQKVEQAWPRFSGEAFTRARGYEGPGEGQGNRIVPRSF